MEKNETTELGEMATSLIRGCMEKFRLSDSIAGSTKLAYLRAMNTYVREKEAARSSGRQFVFDRKMKNSRTVYAAAVRRNVIERLRLIASAKTDSEVHAIATEVRFDLEQISSMMARYRAKNIPETIMKVSWKDRLRILEKVWPDWRDELQSRMAKSKYAKCIAVQRATGCRTEELVSGVRVKKIDDGTYELSVITAKQRVANPDNRLRVIISTDAALEQCIGEVRLHVADTSCAGRSKEQYDHARALAVEKAKKNYRMTMANVSERLFGISITPKGFRCATGADLRSDGANTVGVAEFLGHGSTACANIYTRGLNARGKARVQPGVLKTPRKKVEAKPLSKSLAARKEQSVLAPKP